MYQISALLLLMAASGPVWAELTATEIVRRSVPVNDADFKLLPKFSHRETDVNEKLEPTGEPKFKSAHTYEVSMIDGSPYQKLIANNGVPLPPAELQKETAKLTKEIARRQHESPNQRAERIAAYNHEQQNNHMLMNEMVNAFNFKLTGEEELVGHAVYVLQATPRPDYHPPSQKAKVLAGMKGTLWIDKERFHWVKVEAEVIKPVNFGYFIAKVDPGTRFILEQAPIESDVWLPRRFVETVNAKIFGFVSYRTRDQETYTDYRPADGQLSKR